MGPDIFLLSVIPIIVIIFAMFAIAIVKWCLRKIKEKKYIGPILIILPPFAGVFAAVLWLFFLYTAYNSGTTTFYRHTHGHEEFRDRHSGKWVVEEHAFWEYVYVRNPPQDELEQLKLILEYADKITSGFQTPRGMEKLIHYGIFFYELKKEKDESLFTSFKKIFWEDNSSRSRNRIGEVTFYAICNNPKRWKLSVTRPMFPDTREGHHSINVYNECYRINEEDADTVKLALINRYKELCNKREIGQK